MDRKAHLMNCQEMKSVRSIMVLKHKKPKPVKR